MFDAIVSKFLFILESRLNKNTSIALQILVLMASTEAESEQINVTLQGMKSGIDNICSAVSEKAKKREEDAARPRSCSRHE